MDKNTIIHYPQINNIMCQKTIFLPFGWNIFDTNRTVGGLLGYSSVNSTVSLNVPGTKTRHTSNVFMSQYTRRVCLQWGMFQGKESMLKQWFLLRWTLPLSTWEVVYGNLKRDIKRTIHPKIPPKDFVNIFPLACSAFYLSKFFGVSCSVLETTAVEISTFS